MYQPENIVNESNDVIQKYKEMEEMFGESLPDFEHYPIQFAYYVKLYEYQRLLDKPTQM
jgi:hypothetical protein